MQYKLKKYLPGVFFFFLSGVSKSRLKTDLQLEITVEFINSVVVKMATSNSTVQFWPLFNLESAFLSVQHNYFQGQTGKT